MSLIAAFRCPHGIIVCADSEENWGNIRRSVLKLDPIGMGNFMVVIGGGGPGELIDSFKLRLQARVSRDAPDTLDDFKWIVENELELFYTTAVATYPTSPDFSNALGACPSNA